MSARFVAAAEPRTSQGRTDNTDETTQLAELASRSVCQQQMSLISAVC